MRKLRPEDVDRIVSRLDETHMVEHFRCTDRPDARFVRERSRQPIEVVRAKNRIRTASYRNRMDREGRASTYQIGMSMITALVTSSLRELTDADRGIVGRMLLDLQARGFDVKQTKRTLRRLRNSMVDPADRTGEPTETASEALQPSSWPRARLPS